MPVQVFILTLEDLQSRAWTLADTLRSGKVDPEVFLGVDGRKGLPADLEGRVDRILARERLFRNITDAELACALSHQNIYREIISRGLSVAIVLEDDAELCDGFWEVVASFDPARMELLLLDHNRARVRPGTDVELSPGFSAHRIALPPFRTTGYAISHSGADFLLRACDKIAMTADWPADIARIRTYAIWPRVVRPRATTEGSSIAEVRRTQAVSGRWRRFLRRDYWQRTGAKFGSLRLE
jgi:glycosyl transferase, family 25